MYSLYILYLSFQKNYCDFTEQWVKTKSRDFTLLFGKQTSKYHKTEELQEWRIKYNLEETMLLDVFLDDDDSWQVFLTNYSGCQSLSNWSLVLVVVSFL